MSYKKCSNKLLLSGKRKESSGVSPLKTKDEHFYSDPTIKANILNDQLSSVFNSGEDPSTIKGMISTPSPNMPNINISTEGERKLLAGLNIHKAAGPDGASTAPEFLRV
jgi:hypothetical protein